MATVSAQLDASMAGNDVSARVGTQITQLNGIATQLATLIQHPPGAVNQLLRAFGDLPLPEFQVAAQLSTRLIEMRGAVPTDVSGLLRGVLDGIAQLQTDFGGALGGQLAKALLLIERLHALTQIDLRCLGGASSSTATLTAGGAAGATGASGVAAATGTSAATAPSPSATQDTVARANTILDAIPQPPGIEGVLRWAHSGTVIERNEPLLPAVIPVWDDLRDPVDTLITWDTMTPAQLGVELTTSLTDTAAFLRETLARELEPLAADISALLTPLPQADLTRIADRLTARLVAIGAAVHAGNLSGMSPAATEVHALLDEYSTLQATLPVTLATDATQLRGRLAELADDLHEGCCHAISILRPGGAVLINLPAGLEANALADLRNWLTGVSDWLENVLSAVDLDALQAPIRQLASGAQGVAASLDEALATVVVQVQSLFQQLESLIDAVDIAAITTSVQTAITQFRTEVVQRITGALAPARTAIEQAVGALAAAVNGFDPADIVAALHDAIDRVAGVLQDPGVTAAIGQIKGVIDTATQQVQSLSFTPVTDQVIAVIDALKGKVQEIDPAQLPDAAKAALAAAALVLPSDLQPITDPIVVDFSGLVDSGPVPVLEQVKQQPAKLLEQVTRFEPSKLIGDTLSQPFQKLLRDLDAFRPSKLLKPLGRELDTFKQTLLRSASPSRALQPLAGPFGEVTAALGRLDPTQLTKPIDDALAEAGKKLSDLLPVQDLFDAIDAVLGAVRRFLDSYDAMLALLRRLHGLADALANAPADLVAWINRVLDRIEQVPDPAAVNLGVVALRDAVDATRGAAIGARFNALTATSRAALDSVDGGNRLSALITAYHGVSRPALEALPDSPTRTSLLAALDRFDPLTPSFGAPWLALGQLRSAVGGARAALEAQQSQWDTDYHFAGSALSDLRRDSATPAELRAFAQELLDAQLVQPIAAVSAFLEPARVVFGSILDGVEDLLGRVRSRLDALLLGPQSVQGLRDAMGDIVADVTSLNVDFLPDSLNTLFGAVRARLEAISPAALGKPLDDVFKAILDTLSLEVVLPKAELQALDATYEAFVAKIRPLDPGQLVIEAVQPVWDQTVLPLLAAFDLTPVIEALIEKLHSLDDSLRAELERVNGSYQQLLAAIPSGDVSVSASISL